MDSQIGVDIDLLINVARAEIETADKAGDSNLFYEAGVKYGSVAHRVYMALDVLQCDCSAYHSPSTRRVMLDPWTVFNRASSAEVRDARLTPDDAKFWDHADMIKALIDYIFQVYLKGVDYASA